MAAVSTPEPAVGGKRFVVGESVTPPKPSKDAVLQTIVNFISAKGAAGEAVIRQKVKLGKTFQVKGCDVDAEMLREALRLVTKDSGIGQGNSSVPGRPATPGTAASNTATPSSGSRWTAAAPSAGALAQKALQECETAEPFVRRVKNTSSEKLAILSKPNIFGHAGGETIAPGEAFGVIARCSRVQDGRTYLRLNRSEGWVSTRAHQDLFKVIVVDAETGKCVEPLGCPTNLQSRAAQVLSRVDAEFRRVNPEEVSFKAPRTFRIAGGRSQSILSHPAATGAATAAVGGTLQAFDEFSADAVCIIQAEGRVYLHLQDGRGWVSERMKADYSRFAVEPVGFAVAGTNDFQRPAAPRRMVGMMGGGNVQVRAPRPAVIEKSSDFDAESIKAAAAATVKKAPRNTPLKDSAVVLRSDSELWPKALGAPRPIKGAMRRALREVARTYYTQIKECETDLKEVEARIEGYARACDAKKTLQSHTEVLKKEIAKIEQEWKAAIEKDFSDIKSLPAAPKQEKPASGCTVAPAQVLGEAWHCAVVRIQQDNGEGGKYLVQHVGPLRQDSSAASDDVKSLLGAAEKRAADGIPALSPPAKKSKTKPAAEDAETKPAAEDAD